MSFTVLLSKNCPKILTLASLLFFQQLFNKGVKNNNSNNKVIHFL